jgi:hypothetical protein
MEMIENIFARVLNNIPVPYRGCLVMHLAVGLREATFRTILPDN